MRQYTFRYEEAEEGGYVGQCIELPGAITQAETLEELKANMKDVIELILESMVLRRDRDMTLQDVEIVRQSLRDIKQGKYEIFENVGALIMKIKSDKKESSSDLTPQEIENLRQSFKDLEEGKFKDFDSVDDMFREIESEDDNRH
jgi:predicted RNase H-like HicB family nuclease